MQNMFSHNGKISEKQLRRMLVLSVFAGTIFVIPYLAAHLFETSIVPGLLVFLLFACIYVIYIYGFERYYRKKASCKGKNGKDESGEYGVAPQGIVISAKDEGVPGKLFIVIQVARLIIRLAFYVVLAIAIMGEAQIPFMPGKGFGNAANLLVVLPLLLVAIYGANVSGKENRREESVKGEPLCLGIEKQGRIYEMIFWVLFVPFTLVILLGAGEVDYTVFLPHLDMSMGKLLLCGYMLLTFLLPVENYLYLRPFLRVPRALEGDKTAEEKRGKYSGTRSFFAILITVFFMVILSLLLIGIYGVKGAGQEEMVTIAIMRYIRLPFGVLERFDVLMLWFFMTGCFVLICQTLYLSGYLLSQVFPKIKRIYLLGAVVILVLAAVAFLPEYSVVLSFFLRYGAYADVPLSIIMPLLGFVFLRDESGKK